jgi:hypothetical protein
VSEAMADSLPPQIAFDGETYVPSQDYERLNSQLDRVRTLMADAQWRSLNEISSITGGTEASVSARLRDLRKEKYGAHTVEREHVADGFYRYRLILRRPQTDTGEQLTLAW